MKTPRESSSIGRARLGNWRVRIKQRIKESAHEKDFLINKNKKKF